MAISQISLSNTFAHWIIATNATINQINAVETGNYTKSNGTLTISSTGVGLVITSNTNIQGFIRFFTDAQFDTTARFNNIIVTGNTNINNFGFSNNKITFPNANGTISINRGTGNANAELTWNNVTKNWEARDVDNSNNYNKLITLKDYASTTANGIVKLNDDVNSNSNTLVATANTVKTVLNVTNTQLILIQSAFNKANTNNDYANVIFLQSNTALNTAQSAFNKANTNNDYANVIFLQSNTALNTAQSAFIQANTALSTGQSANTALSTGQSAFIQANTALSTGQSAFNKANNGIYILTNTTISKTLINYEKCIILNPGLTINLPSSGNNVCVSVMGFANTTVGRNGSNIMELAEDFTINKQYVEVHFEYINSTIGWKIS